MGSVRQEVGLAEGVNGRGAAGRIIGEERQQRTEERLGVGAGCGGRSGGRVQNPVDRRQAGGGRQNVRRRGQRAGQRQVVAAETCAVVGRRRREGGC